MPAACGLLVGLVASTGKPTRSAVPVAPSVYADRRVFRSRSSTTVVFAFSTDGPVGLT
jgi:hypothetical protein